MTTINHSNQSTNGGVSPTVLLGRAVRQFREQQRLSQEDLAGKTSMHRTYISDIERGTRNPTIKVLWRLASAFNVQASDIVKTAEQLSAQVSSYT